MEEAGGHGECTILGLNLPEYGFGRHCVRPDDLVVVGFTIRSYDIGIGYRSIVDTVVPGVINGAIL